ncbi:class I SAM-dependent methyltransferase [Dehalococcoidia bacterium]|nr:class I SAM-dependent methyltransferase [Dehalococcoidia bacterium]
MIKIKMYSNTIGARCIQTFTSYLHRQAHSVEARNVVLNFCEQNPNARILDVGCGNGEIALEVGAQIGSKDIWGIEIVEERAANARQKGIRVIQGDLNHPLELESESFDIIHAANIIEHLSNTDTFVREIYRILKGNGYFIVSTCNLASLHNIFFLLLGRQPPSADVSNEFQVGVWRTPRKRASIGPSHRRIFTLKALESLLKCHGFKIEKSAGAGFYPLPGGWPN